jgi:hypothetical protein
MTIRWLRDRIVLPEVAISNGRTRIRIVRSTFRIVDTHNRIVSHHNSSVTVIDP